MNGSNGSQASIEELKELIVREVAAAISNTGKPLLLAALGSLVSRYKELYQNQGLGEFIKSHMQGRIELAQDPMHSTRIAVITPDQQEKTMQYFSEIAVKQNTIITDNQETPVLYRSVTWAFTKPMLLGQEIRYLRIQPPIQFYDKMPAEGASDCVRITHRELLPRESPDDIVYKHAAKFMQDKNISIEGFHYNALPSVKSEYHHGYLLRKLIESQPESIRAQMLIPADVALKLL